MNWYAAHLILYVRFKEPPQEHFPVWENIVLIAAESADEAGAKAELRGHEDEGDSDGSFTWGGRPSTWVFAGVRKLMKCDPIWERPGDGTEVSFTEMELPSMDAVLRLAEGRDVLVQLEDERPTSEQELDAPEPAPAAVK